MTGPRKLPSFRGYTVDMRLREFRKAELGKEPEFIDFASERGEKLLYQWIEHHEQQFVAEVDYLINAGFWFDLKSEWIFVAGLIKDKWKKKGGIRTDKKKAT